LLLVNSGEDFVSWKNQLPYCRAYLALTSLAKEYNTDTADQL